MNSSAQRPFTVRAGSGTWAASQSRAGCCGQHKGTFLLKRVLDDVFAQDVDNIFLEARDATVHILTGFGAEIAGEPFAFYCGNVTPMILTRTAFLQHTNG